MAPVTSTCRLTKVGAVIAGRKTASSGRISGDRVGIGANLARRWFRNCPLSEALLPSYLPQKRPKSSDVTRVAVGPAADLLQSRDALASSPAVGADQVPR